MRTKNAKRLWPVPATLAVMALAAFLAFGLLATTGAQPAAAQDDPDVKLTPPGTAGQLDTDDIDPDSISIAGRQALFEFSGQNSPTALSEGTKTRYYIYAHGGTIEGGSSIGRAYVNGTAAATLDDDGVDDHTVHFRELEVGAPTFDGNEIKAATETLTITRGSQKSVTVYVYTVLPTASFIEAADNTATTQTGDTFNVVRSSTVTITIAYQDPADPDNSEIVLAGTALPSEGHASQTVETNFTVQVRDGADTPAALSGEVVLTVGGGDRVLLQEEADATNVGKTITVAVPASGNTAQVNVIGIPGAGAVRIPIDATFGGVSLETVNIIRVGPANVIEAGIYNFADSDCVDQGNDLNAQGQPIAAADAMANDQFDPTDDDCEQDMRYGRGEKFVLDIAVKDELGSETEDSVEMEFPEVDDLLTNMMHGTDSDRDGTGGQDTDMPFTVYTIGAEAPFEMQTITLSLDNNDDVADVELMFAIAGPIHSHMVEGPDTIELGQAGEYTVTVMDENGGVPHFTDKAAEDTMIDVFVQGLVPGNTRGLSNGVLTLDEATGMKSFFIFAPSTASHGETIRVFIGDETLPSKTIMFGGNRPPMAGAAIAAQMIYTGGTADVESTISDPDNDTLTWAWSSGDPMVATVEADATDMSMATITAVAEGTAMITVSATDPDGMSDMQTFMVTVEDEAMPVMRASGLTATANGNGTVTLNWTPGPNASHHFVAATADGGATYPVWRYSADMNTYTTMAGDVNIGTEYTFYILAGQWEEDNVGNWTGEWAGWSNGATVTPAMSSGPPVPPPPGG